MITCMKAPLVFRLSSDISLDLDASWFLCIPDGANAARLSGIRPGHRFARSMTISPQNAPEDQQNVPLTLEPRTGPPGS